MLEHQLIVMRHAKSDWSEDNLPDFDRPLTARGIKAAKLMGQWLSKQQYNMDRIVCSPALRAKQTCQWVLQELNVSRKNILWEPAIYEASLRDLLSVVDQYSQGVHKLFLIGHNPGLDQLIGHLSKDPLPLSHAGKLMTTGAVAVLNYGTGPISTQSHHASLKHLIRPKEL